MKILSAAIFFRPSVGEPCLLASADNTSEFSFLYRNSIRQFLLFTSRTVLQRTPPSQRQAVQHQAPDKVTYVAQSYTRHVFAQSHLFMFDRADGLGAVIVTDQEYPLRAGSAALTKLTGEFARIHGDRYRLVTEDTPFAFSGLSDMMRDFQDPRRADPLTRVQDQLQETKDVVMKTLDQLLEREVKLEVLMAKSRDLSTQTRNFYKTSKKLKCVQCELSWC